MKKNLRKLYNEIGGEEALRSILTAFYLKMSRDVLIGFFFEGKDLVQIAERQLEFLSVAMGARKSYAGKSPTSAHLHLPPILKGHFDRRLVLLRETLKEHGLGKNQIDIWIRFESSFRPVVQAHGKKKAP